MAHQLDNEVSESSDEREKESNPEIGKGREEVVVAKVEVVSAFNLVSDAEYLEEEQKRDDVDEKQTELVIQTLPQKHRHEQVTQSKPKQTHHHPASWVALEEEGVGVEIGNGVEKE